MTKRVPIVRLALGKGLRVAVHAYTAAEMGVPLVELAGDCAYLQHLTIKQAAELGAALSRAAVIARGQPA